MSASERFEINEAFAAIAIVVTRVLGIRRRSSTLKRAVGPCHAIGATGAILTPSHSFVAPRRLTRGVVTLCIGGGQGIALALSYWAVANRPLLPAIGHSKQRTTPCQIGRSR